jgi:hypothetical protein
MSQEIAFIVGILESIGVGSARHKFPRPSRLKCAPLENREGCGSLSRYGRKDWPAPVPEAGSHIASLRLPEINVLQELLLCHFELPTEPLQKFCSPRLPLRTKSDLHFEFDAFLV